MSWSWPTFWYVLIAGVLLIALILVIWWFISLLKKRRERPSHIKLYFDANFRKIIDEWDLVSRDRVKEFKKDITHRLSKVGDDITQLEKHRDKLNGRMKKLDTEIGKLEGP
jgi:hypothetical protein